MLFTEAANRRTTESLKLLRKYRFWIALIAIVVALLAFAGGVAWFFPQQLLTVDSGEVKADVIVVLGGTPDRAQRAAELFQAGAAPKILVTGDGDDLSNERILEKSGIDATNIIVEGQATTTRENALFSIPKLRAMGAQRVIIVTSWYHSRRGLHCFEHYAPDIAFYSRPSYYGYPSADANRKSIRGYIRSEYVKLTGYWILYGVCPF